MQSETRADAVIQKAAGLPEHLNFLESARRCFRHAVINGGVNTLFIEIGLDYLKLAHEEALLTEGRVKKRA